MYLSEEDKITDLAQVVKDFLSNWSRVKTEYVKDQRYLSNVDRAPENKVA